MISVFFVLSGFVLTYSYYDASPTVGLKSCFEFSRKKIAKLYPLHLVMLFFAFILEVLTLVKNNNLEHFPVLLKGTVLQIFLVQAYVPLKAYRDILNGPTWYLSATTLLYFAFPILLTIVKKYKKNTHAFFSLIGCYLLQILLTYLLKNVDNSYYSTYFFPPYHFFDFFAGCNIAYLFIHRSDDKQNISTKAKLLFTVFELITVAALVFDIWLHLGPKSHIFSSYNMNGIYYQPIICLLIYLLAANKGYISNIFKCSVLVNIGILSGTMYIIHEVIFYYYRAAMSIIYPDIMNYPLITTIIVFLSTLSASILWNRISLKK